MTENREQEWTATDTAELYQLHRWGRPFFSVDDAGCLVVKYDADNGKTIPLLDVVKHFQQQAVTPPLLVRFPDIIRQRTRQINLAFQGAINSYRYRGKYRLFYPVKVNQHQEVIASVMESMQPYGGGLEAGSKAELLAVIALASPETPLLCNGFKDHTVVEMALRAQQLGRDVTIVIEKPNEIDLVIELAQSLGVQPKLGLRVKLTSKGGGHWSNSGGSKSKFGLSVPELTFGINRLKNAGFLKNVNLLHFHPGSQISNVSKIKSSLIEAARIYVDLVKHGVPIKTIDVGGGLAVDYTGNRNQDPSSMNYTLREYANDVVYQIQTVCDQTDTPHPDIYSESGRALVAHHSLLIVPIIGSAHTNIAKFHQQPNSPIMEEIDSVNAVQADDFPPLRELKEIYQELSGKNLLETFHDVQNLIDTTYHLFSNGMLGVWHRAYAERMGWAICRRINSMLDELEFVPRELKQLRNLMADTYFGNFSVFQALPDAWAIKQLFPVMPIHRLNEKPTCHAVLGDITCDSDGKVDCFVGEQEDRDSIAFHPLNDQPYYVGLFTIGAYQEALSDDHNLMGKFHIATIHDPEQPDTWELVPGSTLNEVLDHVHHDPGQMLSNINCLIDDVEKSGTMTRECSDENRDFFGRLTHDYTYLTDRAIMLESDG